MSQGLNFSSSNELSKLLKETRVACKYKVLSVSKQQAHKTAKKDCKCPECIRPIINRRNLFRNHPSIKDDVIKL